MFQQSFDEDLDKILNKMVQNIIAYSRSFEKSNYCCRSDAMLSSPLTIKSYEEFNQVIKICKLTFVLITSNYCPYCYIFKPIFAKVAKIYEGKAAFIEVNADYMPEVAWALNVYSTPTTVIIMNGSPVDAIVGYVPFDTFNKYVAEVLHKAGCINT